jgi:hypothetical protein
VGASWVSENILRPKPDADVRVYAVWVPAFPGDTRASWNRESMPDERVRHFWDEGSAVTHELRLGDFGRLVYDVYAVFGPDARLSDEPIASGGTVIGQTDSLRAALEPLLD